MVLDNGLASCQNLRLPRSSQSSTRGAQIRTVRKLSVVSRISTSLPLEKHSALDEQDGDDCRMVRQHVPGLD